MAVAGFDDLRAGPKLALGAESGQHPETKYFYERDIPMNVDTALLQRESRGAPIRVGMVGAGATGRAIALQLGTPVPGMRLVAIANRTPQNAERALREANIQGWDRVSSVQEAERAIARGTPVLAEDPFLLTACENIDVIVEVTGT